MSARHYLLDTHILIWAVDKIEKILERYLPILADEDRCVVSIVSLWEIAIKRGLGKLQVSEDFAQFVERTGIEILPIGLAHIATCETLPHHHRDPFDRMLIAQAMSENLQLLTVDRNFVAYDVSIA
jgi:PIN domain nuclease of toxin-antitoxin system